MTSTPKPKAGPGPKPDYNVIGDSLYAQTDEGEVVLDLRLPIDKLELLMDMGEMEIEDRKLPRFLLDNVLDEDDAKRLRGLKDGARAYAILMRFAAAVTERLGVSLGESQGSTDSSESTEQHSEPTSDDGTASA